MTEPRPAPAPAERLPAWFFPAYFGGHGLALLAFWFAPRGSWLHALWQAVVTSLCMAFMIVGVRRLRPEAPAGWYFIAGGVFINAWGVVVELIGHRFFAVGASPSAADFLWSALFPAAVLGLLLLLRRLVAREELTTTILNTAICLSVIFFTGIHAWQFVAWRTYLDENISLPYKIIVTAYSFGDLMFLALILRILLAVGPRNLTLVLLVGWLVLMLPSDLGWPAFVRGGTEPNRAMQYFMEASWTVSSVLLSVATWHPDVRAITRSSSDERQAALGLLGWLGLLACLLIGPVVVLMQVLLDRSYSVTSF